MNTRRLSADLRGKTLAEVTENPERLNANLCQLKNWLAKEPHLPAVTDNHLLVTFLRGCKYAVEQTKLKLDFYFTAKTLLPELLGSRDPSLPAMRQSVKMGRGVPLPCLTPVGRRILLVTFNKGTVADYTPTEDFKLWCLNMDLLMRDDDHLVVNGMSLMLDLEGFTEEHLVKMTASQVHKVMACIQVVFPVRIRELHFINPTPFMDQVMAIFRPYLGNRLKHRVFIHEKGSDSLDRHFPKDILPEEYGGEQESFDRTCDRWLTYLDSRRAIIQQEENMKSDESKRLGGPKKENDILFTENGVILI